MITDDQAMRWAGEAERDDRLKPILAEVQATYDLKLSIIAGPEWESLVNGGTAIIRLAETNRPLAAFAHELLHLRLSARGYRHILGSGNHDPAKNGMVSALLQALDNELQHHRMFPDFVSIGFAGADFYAESDDTAPEELRASIEAMPDGVSPAVALLTFLSLVAPGGNWPEGAREEVTELLKQRVSSGTWDKLQLVEAAIGDWAKQDVLDPTETIASVLEILGDFNGTFIAEDVSKYPEGAFIPRSFTKEQFDALTGPPTGVARE